MATRTFTPVLGKRLRATELTRSGAVAAGPDGEHLVTDGFISVNLTAEVEDGTEILQRNASGNLCVNEKMANSFKYFNVEVQFCGVNPSLVSMVSNAEPYSDGEDVIGFTVPEGAIEKWFALELWTGLSGSTVRPGEDEASGYMLLPFITAGTLGDITIDGENAVTFSLSGAITKGGNDWGVGPYDVVYSGELVEAGPLPTAIDPFDHLLLVDTGLTPPAIAEDPQPNAT